MTVVVYTACYGDYDSQIAQPFPIVRFDEMQIPEDVSRPKPRRLAKWWKVNAHEALAHLGPDDVSIWIDSSMRIVRPDFVEWLTDAIDGYEMVAFIHPERDDIHDELIASYKLRAEAYEGQDLTAQVQSYMLAGYRPHSGLWQCGVLARRHTATVAKFNSAWWDEIERWDSDQDQLSFAALATRPRIAPPMRTLRSWDDYIEVRPHAWVG